MARLFKRSLLLYLATFLIVFFVSNLLLVQLPYSRRQQYLLATDNVLSTLNQNVDTSVLPNQSTVILEPSPSLTCQGNVGSGLFILVMVISAPDNVENRELIRSAFREMQPRWEEMFFDQKTKNGLDQLNVTRVFQVLFFVGQSAENGMSDDVRGEWERHGDIIVDDLHESYLNLTVKTLRMLKWVLHNCGRANYLIKMDDDVFLNMPKLFSYLLSLPSGYDPKLVAGHRYEVSVDRNPRSKWFTPPEAYRPEKFPRFVAGFCYILGMKATQEMFEESKQLPLFHLEDVFLTGIVASKQLHYELQTPGDIVTMMLWYHNLKSMKWALEHVIIHEVSPNQFRCWTKLTGTEELGWIRSVWPLALPCLS